MNALSTVLVRLIIKAIMQFENHQRGRDGGGVREMAGEGGDVICFLEPYVAKRVG